MDIKKYIASGILENYILGLATEAEQQQVEQYALEYPEIKAELEAIELAMEDYAQIHQVDTPPGLEASIMSKIDELSNDSSNSQEPPSSNQTKPKNSDSNWSTWLLAFLFLATGVLAWMNYQNATTANVEVNRLNNQLTTLQNDCNQTNQENDSLRQQLLILQDPNNRPIRMEGGPTGTNKAPNAIATIHLNTTTNKSYIDFQSLPPTPSDKQYELWAIVNGTPQNLGQFTVQANSKVLIEIPTIPNASAFAVTLETLGRSDTSTPDLNELYVIGNVSG